MDLEAVKVLLEAQDKTFRTALDFVVDQLKSRIQVAETTISDLTRSLEYTQAEVKDLQSDIRALKKEEAESKTTITALQTRNEDLEKRANYQEDYNRRNNLRITGIQEQAGETWEETANTVSKLLEAKLQLPPMELERAHRTGPVTPSRPRPVVVRFERFRDREATIRNARKLKGTGIYINEDLCPASQELKKSQILLMKQAREDGKIAFFRYTKLIIKEKPTQRPSAVYNEASTSGARDAVTEPQSVSVGVEGAAAGARVEAVGAGVGKGNKGTPSSTSKSYSAAAGGATSQRNLRNRNK